MVTGVELEAGLGSYVLQREGGEVKDEQEYEREIKHLLGLETLVDAVSHLVGRAVVDNS